MRVLECQVKDFRFNYLGTIEEDHSCVCMEGEVKAMRLVQKEYQLRGYFNSLGVRQKRPGLR